MSDFILFLPKESNEVKKIPASDYEEERMLQDLIEKHTEQLQHAVLSSGKAAEGSSLRLHARGVQGSQQGDRSWGRES